MLRCKCGKYTNYGVTCLNCRPLLVDKKTDVDIYDEEFEKEKDSPEELSYDEMVEMLDSGDDD